MTGFEPGTVLPLITLHTYSERWRAGDSPASDNTMLVPGGEFGTVSVLDNTKLTELKAILAPDNTKITIRKHGDSPCPLTTLLRQVESS